MVGLFLSTVMVVITFATANPAQNAGKIVRLLEQKAQECLESGMAPKGVKNFYFSSKNLVDMRVIEQKISKPANRNSFIDAYTRWQLIRFDIALPTLSDVAFQNFLESLPEFPENPRTNWGFCDAVARAATSERPLTQLETSSLQQRLDEMNKKYRIAQSQTIPADEFRLWVIEQLENQPTRVALAHLERLAARVSAGWSSQDALSSAQEAFVEINNRGGLPGRAQQQIDLVASRIAGMNKLALTHVEFIDGGNITPRWRSTAIDEFDLKRLLRLLRKSNEKSDGFLGRDREPPVKSTP
jgi:hypothetical protein